MHDDMQNEPFHQLSEDRIGELLELIRQAKDRDHIAQLYAEICYESALVANHVSKIGFSLSELWRAANDLEIIIKDLATPLLSLHIRGGGDEDNQTITVSSLPANELGETEQTVFILPEQSVEARVHIMRTLFKAFPAERLMTLFGQFADPAEKILLPQTCDEGAIKERAMATLSAHQNRIPAFR